MLEILKKLCDIPSAPGSEKAMLSFIEKEVGAYCDKISYDNMGNLVARHKCSDEKGEKVMLCVYCDTPGYIVNYIEENGYLRLSKLGSPSASSSLYSRISVAGKVCGYIFPEKSADVKENDYSKLYADIGAGSRAEAEKLVKLGDICTFHPEVSSLCTTRIGGSGLSARVGIATVIDIIKKLSECTKDLYFAFAVQENLLHRGAKTASFDVSPDVCICVDVCESLDKVGDSKRGGAILGDGAVILAKASGYTSNPLLCEKLCELSKRFNIKSKTCVYTEQSTACSVISKCGRGAVSACVCIPARGAGAMAQVMDTEDIQCAENLIMAYLR